MIEVLKQMIEALETRICSCCYESEICCAPAIKNAIKAGKQAIAELESQEPVATVTSETGADITMSWWHEPALPVGTKLFTHPPQRTWVGIEGEEIRNLWEEATKPDRSTMTMVTSFAKSIEAKLKERNL